MSKFTNLFGPTLAFHRNHPLISLLSWVNAIMISVPLGLLLQSVLPITACASFLACAWMSRLARDEPLLKERASESGAGMNWRVSVNGSEVGQLSDSTYAGILREVLLDPRIYLQQAGVYLRIVWRLLNYIVTLTPVLVFWSVVGTYVFARDFFVEGYAWLITVTPEMLMASAGSAVVLHVFFLLIGWMIVAAAITELLVGIGLRGCDKFDHARSKRIRQACGCAAEGNVDMFRMDWKTAEHPGHAVHFASFEGR